MTATTIVATTGETVLSTPVSATTIMIVPSPEEQLQVSLWECSFSWFLPDWLSTAAAKGTEKDDK